MKAIAAIFLAAIFLGALSGALANSSTVTAQAPPTPTAPMPGDPTPPPSEALTPTPDPYPGLEPTPTPDAYPERAAVVVGDKNPSHVHEASNTFTPDDAGIWAFLWDLFTK